MPSSFELLNEEIRKLAQERFREATPIQEKAIPEILGGKNVLIIAPTGVGKTEAALLPLLHRTYLAHPSSTRGSLIFSVP